MIQVIHLPDAHRALCSHDFSVSHGGRNNVTSHIKTNCHKDMAKVASTSKSLSSLSLYILYYLESLPKYFRYRPQVAQKTIRAEAMWYLFTVKHNLAFLNSDHATELFKEMFPDSEIAKKFARGCTKMTAIAVKETLSP